jgi:ArsR family transcriptional regulator, arsenate/arsenite/antimonite-responsive transcriptional repressor
LLQPFLLYFVNYENDKMKNMKNNAKIFQALADSNRLRVVKMLSIKPLCVCEITEILGLATSTVSKHLAILRDAGFILDEKNGKWVDYRLNESPDNPIIEKLLKLVRETFNDDLQSRKDAEAVKNADRLIICNQSDTINISIGGRNGKN